jgi:hypothetical protein
VKFAICNEIFQGWSLPDTFAYARKAGYDAVEIAPFTIARSVRDISAAQRSETQSAGKTAHRRLTAAGVLLALLAWAAAIPSALDRVASAEQAAIAQAERAATAGRALLRPILAAAEEALAQAEARQAAQQPRNCRGGTHPSAKHMNRYPLWKYLVIAVALLFAQALTVVDVPQQFVAWVTSFATTRESVILIMLVIWIIAGMFMETGPNIVVLGPLMKPLADSIGMDPIHFCVFMITTLGLGFITPPFGLNLFVMSGLTRTPIGEIAGHALPFVFTMVLVSALIGFVPEISLFTLR